jgi:putative aldouronate transport system permease protein
MTLKHGEAAMIAAIARRKPVRASETVFNIVNYTILILFTLVCLYPFYYILIYSLSDTLEVAKGAYFFPRGFTIESYVRLFNLDGILTATIVSIGRTVIGTVITVFCCSFFAYLMTIDKYPGRKACYRFVFITMYLNAGLIPWYILMKALGLKNNFLLYVLPSAMNAFYIILIKTYIEQLPKSLEESAKIDGAGYFKIYYRIILPISTAVIATIVVFTAVGQWNSFLDNYFLVSDRNLFTLQYLVYQYITDASAIGQPSVDVINSGEYARHALSQMTVRMTVTMAVSIPILLVYPLAQRYFVKGIMMGAIKG